MRRFVALAWAIPACGQTVPPAATAKAPEIDTRERGGALEIPRAPFVVVPAELGDDRVLERIPHRAMVKRWSGAWLTETGAPIGDPGHTELSGSRDILPVIGERGTKIRIVVDDDNARYAAWIVRDDAWSTALVPFAISSGASVEPGVALEVKAAHGTKRQVSVVDELLSADGAADARAIGEVWIAPIKSRLRPKTEHDLVRLPRGAELRATADANAAIVATITGDELVVAKVGEFGAFTEVLGERPYLHVRGFVPTAKVLGTADDFVTFGTGTGHGFGMSHATKHEVPAGTCLYDRADGDVVGVTLEAESRLGGQLREDGWAMVYIDSPWRVTSMYLKNLGTDPAAPPTWDSCTEPAHRR